MKKLNENGFTLVELAIVMTIIGLIIGGILKGQELVTHARTRSVIKQINSYTSAVTGFRDRYKYLPGDFPFASTRITNCNPTYCTNGDGNGILGDEQYVFENVDQSRTSENQQFWEHLALSDFTGGIETNTPTMGFGYSHPNASYGGGFTAIYSRLNGAASPQGLWLRLHNDINGNPEQSARVTPHWGAIVDRKIDDGDPGTGSVRAFQYGSPSPGDPHNCEFEYDESSEKDHCLMTFQIAN